MEKMIEEKEIKELMQLKGEVRGVGMRNYAKFVLKEEGEEGLEKLEELVAKLGYPMEYQQMRVMEFFPIGLEALTLLAIKQLFNYDDKKFQEMGEFGVKLSIIVRLFMKYFVSLPRLLKEAANMWRRGSTVGDFKVIDHSFDKKYSILRLENFRLHPLHCQVIKGYLSGALKMILKGKATIDEQKCIYEGDDYHEFLVKW